MTNYVEYVHEEYSETTHDIPEAGPVVYRDREQTVWWAVRPSPDAFKAWKDDESEPEDFKEYFTPGFTLMGGDKVVVYDKDSLAGVRGLLDEIEKLL